MALNTINIYLHDLVSTGMGHSWYGKFIITVGVALNAVTANRTFNFRVVLNLILKARLSANLFI